MEGPNQAVGGFSVSLFGNASGILVDTYGSDTGIGLAFYFPGPVDYIEFFNNGSSEVIGFYFAAGFDGTGAIIPGMSPSYQGNYTGYGGSGYSNDGGIVTIVSGFSSPSPSPRPRRLRCAGLLESSAWLSLCAPQAGCLIGLAIHAHSTRRPPEGYSLRVPSGEGVIHGLDSIQHARRRRLHFKTETREHRTRRGNARNIMVGIPEIRRNIRFEEW